MNLLIIDNDYLIRKGVKRTLANTFPEHKIHEADSIKEALSIMEFNYIDIILTDITMREMKGLSFIETYSRRFSEAQWVIMTEIRDFNYVREAIRLGVKNYLLKPLDKFELCETLNTLLVQTGHA